MYGAQNMGLQTDVYDFAMIARRTDDYYDK